MYVGLSYENSGLILELENKSLKDMDKYTKEKFNSEQDVLNDKKYVEKIGLFLYENEKRINLDEKGKIVLSYYPTELPLQELYKFPSNGEDMDCVHFLQPMYKGDRMRPDQLYLVGNFQTKIKEVTVAKNLLNIFKDNFSFMEINECNLSIISRNTNRYTKQLGDWFQGLTTGEEGYFFARLINDIIEDSFEESKEKGYLNKVKCLSKK